MDVGMDEFSDDGLNDLSDSALEELEKNAIQATQARQLRQTQAVADTRQVLEGYTESDFEDDDLDISEVTNDLLPPVARPPAVHQLHTKHPQLPASRSPITQRWNQRVLPVSTTRLQSRPSYPSQQPPPPVLLQPQVFQPTTLHVQNRNAPLRIHQPLAPPLPRNLPPQSQPPPTSGDSVVTALEQRVKALQDELNIARGEAAIVRSKSIKAEQDHEAEVARLRRLNSEQLAKQERLVEAAKAAKDHATTELQFLQRDMEHVKSRVKRSESGPGRTLTPKKPTKTWGINDGFNDMDFSTSPSKAQRSTVTSSFSAAAVEKTPTKGKRKRSTVDSPVPQLDTGAPVVVMAGDGAESWPLGVGTTSAHAPTFEFIQLVLDHASVHGRTPTFDNFSRYFFPSDRASSIASILFQALPSMGNPRVPMQLLVDFSLFLIGLWGRCIDEGYVDPIMDLASMVSFTLQLHTISVAPYIIEALVPVAQASIYLVAEPRVRVSNDTTETIELNGKINTTELLSLLHVSSSAFPTTSQIQEDGNVPQIQIWKEISYELVSLLLHPNQQMCDVILMLDILSTSVFEDRIGPIVEHQDPTLIAWHTIEMVSGIFGTFPAYAITSSQRCILRLAAARTLAAFAASTFGHLRLALHENAIPRLVTVLSNALDELYEQDIRLSCKDGKALEESLTQLISLVTLILYVLIADPRTAEKVNVNAKLTTAHGATQRYLVALSRLTFAEEDLVFEAGVDSETAERAHELLELLVTPDEGKLVAEAFRSKEEP